MLVALLPIVAVTGCDDGPSQTVQRYCGGLAHPSTLIQLGSPVDLDTCEPDFSSRTVRVNILTAVDAIRTPLEEDSSGTLEVWVYPDDHSAVEYPESATVYLDRFVLGEGAGGSLSLVEEDGSESTIDIDAVWCERAAGTPPCD